MIHAFNDVGSKAPIVYTVRGIQSPDYRARLPPARLGLVAVVLRGRLLQKFGCPVVPWYRLVPGRAGHRCSGTQREWRGVGDLRTICPVCAEWAVAPTSAPGRRAGELDRSANRDRDHRFTVASMTSRVVPQLVWSALRGQAATCSAAVRPVCGAAAATL